MNAKLYSLRHADYIGHMIEAISLARSHVEGMSKNDFLADKKTQQAVILNIIVIGEAATKIADESPEFAAAHANIPWKQMRGMRNRMAHGYFEINLDVVWDTV
jgi:uncharacterized protein with HEPN domain